MDMMDQRRKNSVDNQSYGDMSNSRLRSQSMSNSNSKTPNNNMYPDSINSENVMDNIDNINSAYYESLKLQPYTFIKDEHLIEENLQTGQYLRGEIRINRCHTHGYITVIGLDNDILIRGNRNLNQSLHLDEVIVELFPITCWKPLFNKKIKPSKYSGEGKQLDTESERVIYYIYYL